ncbi:MAG: GNAT family N-acetyltransferase [Thiothrix sp.]|nr:GNAT family N-acetyltransferase [Thiothrix sp.]HPE60382.1 GNAT family N-acetyltransferase [Thiolinea sp.]
MKNLYAYIPATFNQPVDIVLPDHPVPDGRLCTDLPYMPAPFLDLPDSLTALEDHFRSSRHIQGMHKAHRQLERAGHTLEFRLARTPEAMAEWLPVARTIFLERWQNRYSSFAWGNEQGFSEYLQSLTELAGRGMAELSIGLLDRRPVTYALGLIDQDTFYFFHHATIIDPQTRKYSIGRQSYYHTLCRAVELKLKHFDFMVGEDQHKAFWTTNSRMTCRRICSSPTFYGRLTHPLKVLFQREKIRIQNNKALKKRLQSLLGLLYNRQRQMHMTI